MAAGRGTRMRSTTPKVLHPLCGRTMIEWVVAAARAAGAGRIVCVTRPGDGVAEQLPSGVEAVEQRAGEGTAAAVLAARDRIDAGAPVLTLSGDHPLVGADLLEALVREHERSGAAATLLTTDRLDPSGYGRILRRPDGSVERIVEPKSADGVAPQHLAIREINLGTYAFQPEALLAALERVPDAGGERYLTAVFEALRSAGGRIATHRTEDLAAAIGVNDRAALMAAEAVARERILGRLARAGVTIHAPATVAVDADVEVGADTQLGPGTVLRGSTTVGAGCVVGPQATIVDSRVGDGAEVVAAHVVEAEIGPRAAVGPFAYLRPGARLAEGAKVGAFVEVKNATIGAGAKVPHLSYIGDADVGAGANLGASTITANYDGREKHRTEIGAGARTGVHTSLVAPVSVGDEAYTGAGSVVTDDVPDGALGIARPRQRNVEGYADRVRDRER